MADDESELSEEQLLHDLQALAGRVNPVMSEHCDAWTVIGVRAGDDSVVLNVTMLPNRELQERIENEILSLAADIVRRRLVT